MPQEMPGREPEKLRLTKEELAKIEQRVKRAEGLANLLDSQYLDPILGLFEGAGDAASALAGAYIIYEAKRLNVPTWELTKMLGRTGLDFLAGSIPFIGDLFDFVYKSNKANAAALRQHFERIAADQETLAEEEGELIEFDRAREKRDLEGPTKMAA